MTPGRRPASSIVKHSLVIAGHRTSVSLEQAFWTGLKALAEAENQSVSALVAAIDRERGASNLSSAIRVHVLQHAASAAATLPHEAAE